MIKAKSDYCSSFPEVMSSFMESITLLTLVSLKDSEDSVDGRSHKMKDDTATMDPLTDKLGI